MFRVLRGILRCMYKVLLWRYLSQCTSSGSWKAMEQLRSAFLYGVPLNLAEREVGRIWR